VTFRRWLLHRVAALNGLQVRAERMDGTRLAGVILASDTAHANGVAYAWLMAFMASQRPAGGAGFVGFDGEQVTVIPVESPLHPGPKGLQ
jgi:hypothetical protein